MSMKQAEYLVLRELCRTDLQRERLDTYAKLGSHRAAAKALGVSPTAVLQSISQIRSYAANESISPDAALPSDREALLATENRDLKRQVRDLTREAVDTTKLRNLIMGMETGLEDSDPPEWLVRAPKPGTHTHHGVPTLFLSDLHWGETVYPAQVNGVNKFNLPIARLRLKRAFTQTVKILRDYLAEGEYDGFVLPLGGDMISGNIHEELRETNEEQVLACLLDLHDCLVAGIDLLVSEFGKVFIPCVVGNHGRMDRKPRAKGGVRDNFEWVLYQYLARHYRDDERVTVAVSESKDYLYRVYDTTYLLTHGDQFRGGSGISGPMTPWALGDHRKRKRQDAINQPYDIMIFGHWHTLFMAAVGKTGFICNGSLKGYDEYAFQSNFAYQPPMQAMWLTHPTRGLTSPWPIFVDEMVEPTATRWVSVSSEVEVT